MNVKPARPGLVIRDPRTRRRLPDEGRRVPDTTFWRRRLRAGDVVLAKAPSKRPAPKPAEAKGGSSDAS